MFTNIYPVAPHFPNGLNLAVLKLEMPTIWPADLALINYTLNAKPSGPTGVTAGVLRIDTPRLLTNDEEIDAKAHFLVHAGGVERPGQRGSQLPPAIDSRGTWTFIADEPQSDTSDLGTMVYSDGKNWLRVSDNAIAVTV